MNNKMNNETVTLSTRELIILEKCLYNAKFLCHTLNSYRLANDSLTRDLMLKILEHGRQSLIKEGIGASSSDWPFIDNGKYEEEMAILRKHIGDVDEWNEFTIEEKKEVIIGFIEPLNYQLETINELIIYGNQYHK
jgi:hypothetical protein